ncbi:DUF3791 domain-containing protein [Prevotella sp. PINT]|jgi:hypothetical protein|uniref:DUF3791 domain-containing protein n=1 Tax=Palleniella intestinalis TaxID=2736291 RepID=UPI001555835C|nr:DUF3791 domain-containing protein [Palleniella intestinalis]NPD81172.1 DUF3791 domain-containing protein [Palleniella intestinalis]
MRQEHVEYITAVIGTLSLMLGVSSSCIYNRINAAGVIDDYLVKCYDVLHTFSLEYVAQDIIEIMKRKGQDIC